MKRQCLTPSFSCNTKEAARGTSVVASSIDDVNQHAVETGRASQQMLVLARSLAADSNQLNAEIDTFLRSVRA